MYYVEWCDHEGNLHVLECEQLDDALAEREYLLTVYDWCEIRETAP